VPVFPGSVTGGDDAASADGSSAITGGGLGLDDEDLFEGLGWLDTLTDQGDAVSFPDFGWVRAGLSCIIFHFAR
jgi:hypothetical protein